MKTSSSKKGIRTLSEKGTRTLSEKGTRTLSEKGTRPLSEKREKNQKKIEMKQTKLGYCTHIIITAPFGSYITNLMDYNKWENNNNFRKWSLDNK